MFKRLRAMAASYYTAHKKKKRYVNGKGKVASNYIERNQVSPISKKDRDIIDRYWMQYGVKLEDYSWHQMYYDITGKKDPRFIPHNFLDAVVVPYYNDRSIVRAWTDKNFFQRFLPCLSFPETYGQIINGRYYDYKHQLYTKEDFDFFCESVYSHIKENDEDTIVIKKTINTNQGKGVKKQQISSASDLSNILQSMGSDNCIIQRAIKQHSFFEQFNPSSVNIVRITTWRKGKDILVFAPCVRFGVAGFSTDVAYVNGEEIINCIGIHSDGRIMDYYVTLAGEKKLVSFVNSVVPKWDEMIAAVKKGHLYLERFDLVAWDMTVDSEGNVICIEYNLYSPGSIVYQMAHGPLAGDYTDDFLSFLRNPENQNTYLPRMIQVRQDKSQFGKSLKDSLWKG